MMVLDGLYCFLFEFFCYLCIVAKEVWRLALGYSQIHGNSYFAYIHIQRHAEYMDLCHSSDNSSSNPFAGPMAHKR